MGMDFTIFDRLIHEFYLNKHLFKCEHERKGHICYNLIF